MPPSPCLNPLHVTFLPSGGQQVPGRACLLTDVPANLSQSSLLEERWTETGAGEAASEPMSPDGHPPDSGGVSLPQGSPPCQAASAAQSSCSQGLLCPACLPAGAGGSHQKALLVGGSPSREASVVVCGKRTYVLDISLSSNKNNNGVDLIYWVLRTRPCANPFHAIQIQVSTTIITAVRQK